MWNDWLSSLTGPSNEHHFSHPDVVEPMETPRRFSNPLQIERLQSLQSQHQQLQVQQLHLLNTQIRLQRIVSGSCDSPLGDASSSSPQSSKNVVSGSLADVDARRHSVDLKNDDDLAASVKSEADETASGSDGEEIEGGISMGHEVWQQFHALQAQQWAQALNQARIAKRQSPSGMNMNSISTQLNSAAGLGLLPSGSGGSGISGGKRCKAYAAPKGVWKNNGGYNATIYVHKRRIYGPIRRDLSDAIEDRKEMEEALRDLTSIHNSPEDAAILEVEMREVVAGLRNRSAPNRPDGTASLSSSSGLITPSRLLGPTGNGTLISEAPRKRLRLLGSSGSGSNHHQADLNIDEEDSSNGFARSPDVLGPFSAPMQIKHEDEHLLSGSSVVGMYHRNLHSESEDEDHSLSMMHVPRGVGYTPSTGPMRDMYGSPGIFGAPGLIDDDSHLDMLPDGLGASLWGTH
jgi:hypothetical protein